MRRLSKTAYIIIGLLIIGGIRQITANPSNYILPLAVIGIVLFLYKFPPGKWRKTSSKRGSYRKSKSTKFRVIQGNKKDDDDETPRYH